jgi:octaprenyl-diphosphate synthase
MLKKDPRFIEMQIPNLLDNPIFLKKFSLLEKALQRELDRYKDSLYYESLLYALKGGKRLRPILLLLCSEIIGEPVKEPYSAAIIVELIHTVSLVHDDMIDKDVYRRGMESYHVKYGEEQALLLADFVLSLVLELSMRYADTEIPYLISRTVRKMSEGQLLEVKLRSKEKITWDEYFKIIDGKTASLFELSSRAGAILTTEDPYLIKAISDFGRNLGILYQIYDDLRDWSKKEYVQKLEVENKNEFLKKKMEHYHNLAYKSLNLLPESVSKDLLLKFLDIILKI